MHRDIVGRRRRKRGKEKGREGADLRWVVYLGSTPQRAELDVSSSTGVSAVTSYELISQNVIH